MERLHFRLFDRDSKASTDESAPPRVPMAPMSKPKFRTDSVGSLGGSSGTAFRRHEGKFRIDSGGISGGLSGIDSWLRYKGVSYSVNKWMAEILVPRGNKGKMGMKIRLGSYATPLGAAVAYDVALMCIGGDESMLNFHHPIYEQIPRILPDLSPLAFRSECSKVVKEFEKLAREAGNSVPMTLVGKPKYNTDSGSSPGGLPGISQEHLDLCPKCGKTFLGSQSMLFHLSNHWINQKFSPPPQSSCDSSRDSRFPRMDSRWWLMYKAVRHWEVDNVRVATQNTKELLPQMNDWKLQDKWAAWIWLPHGNEILLDICSSPLEAAYAYDVAVTCLGGKPLLNFHGHPIYEQIPRISLNLSPQVFATELKNVVKEFVVLAMEAECLVNAGGLEQKMTRRDFLYTPSFRKSAQDEDAFLNCSTQQAGDLDTFQKSKRCRFSDISWSGHNFEEYYPNMFNVKTVEDIPTNNLEPKVDMDMLGMLPPYSSTSALDISDEWLTLGPANTKNKQCYQIVSPGHEMLSRALRFTMAELNIMTWNFSERCIIGQGGSGSVYLGQLKNSTFVAVKRMKKNVLENEDTKGAFALGAKAGVPYGVILDMSKRCRISLDVVAALRYLHNQNKDDLDIIHRDIKSSDILITNDFRAKVAGFGLSQRSSFGDVGGSSSSTQVKGTLGYMAREHLIAHHLKEQNDVYLFGELLVEIFTGKLFVESNFPSDECFTPRWVLKQCVEGRLVDIIDPKITPTTFNLKILEQIFKLAASCSALEGRYCPTIEDIFWDLSFIVGRYFTDLKDESNSKGDKYEVLKQWKWDPEAYIESNLQTLCLEESEALKRHKPRKHLDKTDSSNPSFMPSSLFIEGSESNKIQTSMQLDSILEVDSKQPSRQPSELLVAKQDQTSLMFINIIPDVIQLKSDETYFEMLQEEIEKLGYISKLLSQGDDFEQNLTNIGKTSLFLYFNEKDNVFEFYFKNYQGMARIVGVGLECAKVVLKDGWRVTIQEISRSSWNDAWKNLDSSSSTMKITIPEPLEEGMDNMEEFQEPLASIPSGQCLLLDLAQYFILKMAISSFLPRDLMTHANGSSGTSSSSSSQDIARSPSSSDRKPSAFLQAMKSIFISQEAFNQLKTKNGDGPPLDPPGDDVVKTDTTVHLKLLPGGCLYDGSNLLDATISNDKELETLTSQLDNTIYLEMMFKFLNEDDIKEIQVIVGPISFQFQVENEDNYKTTGRFGWYHKLLDVSFGPINACDSEIGPNHSSLNVVKGKKIITTGSSDATTRGTSKSMNGGVKGSVPYILALSARGSSEWSTTKCVSDNVGYTVEKDFEETRGGFAIFPERNLLSSTLKYTYRSPDYMHELDHGKLPSEDYRKFVLNSLPMCIPQDVKFEGTWHPKDSEYNPQVLVEYSLITSRVVHMTSEEISEKVVKKSWIKRCGHPKLHKESNEPLKYTQKYARSFFLNHAMTHLNGEKFKVKEFLHQRPLNERELETHLEDRSRCAPQWRANPLVELNSEHDYQP